MVKIYTMVKDEIDIVKDWIIYHGSMFGWNNLYIIDNFSSDGTWEAINELRFLGINIYREKDYLQKGIYMNDLINKHSCNPNDSIAFPMDIDEFIVYYDKENKKVNIEKDLIRSYFQKLPQSRVYKANYIYPYVTQKEGFERAAAEAEYGFYSDYGKFAKSFINTKYYAGEIDHGNHIPCDSFLLTDIHLLHFHSRNIQQHLKKIQNNILGLGYSNDLSFLKKLLVTNKNCMGFHHVINQINILENNYHFDYHAENIDTSNSIDIRSFKKRILGGYF